MHFSFGFNGRTFELGFGRWGFTVLINRDLMPLHSELWFGLTNEREHAALMCEDRDDEREHTTARFYGPLFFVHTRPPRIAIA